MAITSFRLMVLRIFIMGLYVVEGNPGFKEALQVKIRRQCLLAPGAA